MKLSVVVWICVAFACAGMSPGTAATSRRATSRPGGFQSAPATVRIRVDAGKRASFQIPRTVFGSFLEPIGNSTYNGLWAEILQNPSFEENLWSASNVARMVQEEPSLARASQLGLPLPWEPLDPKQGNRYEPRWGDAANSWRSLAVFGLPNQATGIKQKVYLPVYRELRYHGSLYVKHLSGPERLDISLRRREHPDHVFAHAALDASAREWMKYNFNSRAPGGFTVTA